MPDAKRFDQEPSYAPVWQYGKTRSERVRADTEEPQQRQMLKPSEFQEEEDSSKVTRTKVG